MSGNDSGVPSQSRGEDASLIGPDGRIERNRATWKFRHRAVGLVIQWQKWFVSKGREHDLPPDDALAELQEIIAVALVAPPRDEPQAPGGNTRSAATEVNTEDFRHLLVEVATNPHRDLTSYERLLLTDASGIIFSLSQQLQQARLWHEKAHTFLEERNAYKARSDSLQAEVERLKAKNAHLESIIKARDEQLTAEIAATRSLAEQLLALSPTEPVGEPISIRALIDRLSELYLATGQEELCHAATVLQAALAGGEGDGEEPDRRGRTSPVTQDEIYDCYQSGKVD